ncbi:MAG: alpha/beta hydrolase [Mangrovibacterium sp.]
MKNKKFLKSLALLSIFTLSVFNSWAEEYEKMIYNTIELSTYEYADNLKLDFFSAKRAEKKDRPLIIVMHGGGFQGGDKASTAEVKFCREMARRGFAMASMNYRLIRAGKGFDCNTSYEDKLETFREATKDLLSATNFLIEKSAKLKFDTTRIILLGSSAGAEAVLNTVYMKGSDVFEGINYGKAKFAGVISLAGAIINMDEFDDNVIPTIAIHGEKDDLVPYGKAPHHFCSENTPGYFILYGAEPITNRLKEKGLSYMLLHDPRGNHGWSNWGYNYAQDIANFINKAIIKGEKVQIDKEIIKRD